MKLEDLRSGMLVAMNSDGLVYKGIVEDISDKKSNDGGTLINVKLKIPLDRKKELQPMKDGEIVLMKLSKCLAVL